MVPVLGFMKYLAKFQKLGLKTSSSLSRFSGINAQYFMNLFPKAAKIARKILFTALLIIKLISFARFLVP